MNDLADWVGREETAHDTITAAPVAAMAATLDVALPGEALPPLWHWLYFTPKPRPGEIGPDGHAHRGGFLPPVTLQRRMWAGGRLEWRRPLRMGESLTRRSRIAAVQAKHGRSGPLVFVTVRHEIGGDAGLALSEEHDIVYRDAPPPGEQSSVSPAARVAPAQATFSQAVEPDPVLLFRYSALTFNGHRIHYDRSYATKVEGYPGLVVHGPLIATLLAQLGLRQRPGETARRFEFRAVRPVFDLHAFTLAGHLEGEGRCVLWASDHEGQLAMQASLETMPG